MGASALELCVSKIETSSGFYLRSNFFMNFGSMKLTGACLPCYISKHSAFLGAPSQVFVSPKLSIRILQSLGRIGDAQWRTHFRF